MSIAIPMNPAGRVSDPRPEHVEAVPLPHPRQASFLLYQSKLGGVGGIRLMALIGGFCVSAVAELKGHETAAPWLLILFTVVTVLLTSMTAFVILFTACLLPYMTANAELDSVLCSTGLIHRFKSHRTYFLERGFQTLIQITWLLTSTGIVFLFLIDMILITWIKFQRISKEAAYAGTTIISPTILLIIYFGIRFWKELLQRKLFGDQLIQEEDDEDLDSRFLQSISVRGGPPPQPKRKLSDAPGTSGTKMS